MNKAKNIPDPYAYDFQADRLTLCLGEDIQQYLL